MARITALAPEAPPDLGRPLPRQVLGGLALAGCLGALLAVVLPPTPAALCVLVFVVTTPGALLAGFLPPIPRVLAIGAIPVLGASFMSLLLSAELAAGAYAPSITLWVMTVLSVPAGVWLLRRQDALDVARPKWARPDNVTLASLGFGFAGTLCWVFATPAVRVAPYNTYGLAFEVPLLVVGVILCALGVLLAIQKRVAWAAWVSLVLLVFARRGLTLFGTEAPMYQWTYRHLGVVDWFAHSGTLARDVDVYNNWPGALALASWLTQVSGLSRFDIASAYIIYHHLALIAVAYVLARSCGLNTWAGLLVCLSVELTDWVGQDYLAPQSFAFLVGLIVIAALLTSRHPQYRRGSLWVSVIGYAAVCWAHQLTPVWLLAIAAALVSLRIVRPAWILLPFALIFGSMMVLNLPMFLSQSTGFSLDFETATSGNIRTPVSAGQAFTSRVVSALALGLWGSAAATAAFRLWRTRRGIIPVVVAFSPFVLLLTAYGGEAIYRVYLYTLPGVAVILAPALARLLVLNRARAAFGAVGALLIVALAGQQGVLGGWYPALFPRQDVEIALRLDEAAGPRGVIATPVIGFPKEFTWRYVPRARSKNLEVAVWSLTNEFSRPPGVSPAPIDRLTQETRADMSTEPVYVVLAGPMWLYAAQYGTLPPSGLDELDRFLRERGWLTVVSQDGVTVYGNPAGMRAWQRTTPTGFP